jgi:hypothetical protein
MTNENWRGDNRRRKTGHRSQQFSNESGITENIHNRGKQNNVGKNFGGRNGSHKKTGKEPEKNVKGVSGRPKWTAVKLRSDPIPTPLCVYCKEPIKELASAIMDKDGEALHFECVQKRIAVAESLGKGDTVTYIGGGRFGIVRFENPNVLRKFKIKKIIEWEQKDKRAPWRGHIADHFSLT